MYVKKNEQYLKGKAYRLNTQTLKELEEYITNSPIYSNKSEFLRSALRNYMIEYLTHIKKYDPKNWKVMKDENN